MTTIAQPYTRAVFPAIARVRRSAVLSGIVPDREHLDDGGYHCSIDDLLRHNNGGDYSNSRPLDRVPPVTVAGRRNACAIDISMSPADMKATYKSVDTVWKNRRVDTRTKYINAINVWDGNPAHTPVRFNFQAGTRTKASKDHTWHGHGDWPRVFVDAGYNRAGAERASRAMVSVWTGQTHDAWQRQERIGPYAPTPTGPPAKPTTPTTPTPVPEDDHMIESHTLPQRHAYRESGTDGIVDPSAILVLPLPPVGHPDHSWGKAYRRPYVSLAGDHMKTPQRVRVAINNGAKWTVREYEVKAGARFNVEVPDPANLTAYNLVIGRLAPAGLAADAPLPDPEGVIGVLVELIRK